MSTLCPSSFLVLSRLPSAPFTSEKSLSSSDTNSLLSNPFKKYAAALSLNANPSSTFHRGPIIARPVSMQSAMQRPPEADVMGSLLRQRIVFLGSQLDDFVADATVSQLLLLDAQDSTQDIRLFINSSGGSMSATMAVYDAINLCRADVSTIAFGIAASTAALLLAAGTPGKRFAMPNARIMVHQPLGGASGQAIDVEIQAREVMYHKANVARIYSEITGRDAAQIERDIERDRYFSPMEAVDFGIIDGVIDKETIMPLIPVPERVKPRYENNELDQDPSKLLVPIIPDDEIY